MMDLLRILVKKLHLGFLVLMVEPTHWIVYQSDKVQQKRMDHNHCVFLLN